MPLCTLHLLALSTPLQDFLPLLRQSHPQPLITSRVIRWIIKPTSLSTTPLLTQQTPPWTLLLIYASQTELPSSLAPHIASSFTLTAGVPSALVSKFPETNEKLLHPRAGDVPALTGALDDPSIASSAQNLELTDELRGFIGEWDPKRERGAVSMLNLLAFKEGKHEQYLKYGKAFSESIGSRRGGVAKVVGKVVGGGGGEAGGSVGGEEEGKEWDEVALAHYPSIWHFADMAGSKDYQAVNKEHRVGSLRDTCILMTSEVEVERVEGGGTEGGKGGSEGGKAKL